MFSSAANEAVVRRFWDEVLGPDGGYEEGIKEVWADDLVWHGPAGLGTVHGKEEYLKILKLFLSSFPDIKVTPEKILADDDENLVTTRYTWHGTHTGEFMGVAPTGRPVTVTGVSIYRIKDNKIVEEWFHQDLLGLMQQLGAAPMPGGG